MKNRTLKDLKVLLVEDEESISRLFREAIGDSFYSLSIAKDPLEGIALFKKLKPDIVITDIMMPHISGLEMAKKLREINPYIHIIILSAFSEKEKLLSAIDIGINKYFLKPFDIDELLEYIQSITPKLISEQLVDHFLKLDDGFVFNKSTNSLYKNEKFVPLTKNEMKFLSLFLNNQKSIVDDEIIKKSLWQEDVSDERVRTFIKRFREKTSKKLIKNVKGVGYQLTFNGN